LSDGQIYPDYMKVIENAPLTFKCIGKGHIEWKLNDRPLDPRFVAHKGQVVVIFKVQKAHGGTYKCSFIYNNVSASSAVATLLVLGI